MFRACNIHPPHRTALGLVLAAAVIALGTTGALAQVTIYSNLASWQAAAGNYNTDNLQAEALGLHPTPYTTVGNWFINTIGPSVNIQVIDNGLVNGSREFHFRDFGSHVRFTAPNAPYSAMGLSYRTSSESWQFIIGDVIATLPNNTNGFIGFTSNPPRADFILTSPSSSQGGISIDNLLTGAIGCAADFNHDGVVNSQDFFDFLAAFFAGC
jgi:hypothetical protein